MAFIAQSHRNKFWFGTELRSSFDIPTPNRGADVSAQGWADGGQLLNGGAYQLNSFGSARNYIFEWPASSAREVAQLMKSYADGTYGRGLIYFLDPLTWTTNVLPAMWADPSMGVGYEGASLVYGVEATGLPTSGGDDNELPVTSAYYNLSTVDAGWRGKEDAVFIPIPEGCTLVLGSIHTQSGTGRVFYREQATNGALGAITELSPITAGSSQVANTVVSGASLAGIWLYIGKTSAGAGSVTLTAMTGRIIESAKIPSTMVAQNLFTNPNLVGDGTWAEVRRNLATNPSFESVGSGNVPRRLGGTGNMTIGGGATLSRSSEWSDSGDYSVEITGGSSNTTACYPAALNGAMARIGWTPGGTYTVSATLRLATAQIGSVNPSEARVIAIGIIQGGVTNYNFATSNQAPNEAGVYRLAVTVTIPEDVDDAFIRLTNGSDTTSVWWDSLVIEEGATSGEYFDGSTTPETAVGVEQPEDFRWRWLGLPNESESVMEIENVAGLTAVNSVAGVSTRDGKPAIRSIATNPSNPGSSIRFPVPSSARASGTLVASLALDEPLTGALNNNRLSVGGTAPYQPDAAPNEAGDYALRSHFTSLTSGFEAVLFHGGREGSGDVWWTDIGLFAGDYDGPAFSGDSSGVVINGRNVRTQWDGTPNNSTSSVWTTTPAIDALQQGPWVGGQGHSGCRFIGKPTYINNTGVGGGQVSFAASFREVGSWVNG